MKRKPKLPDPKLAERIEAWQVIQPRRCDTNRCDPFGSCLRCNADQGEICRRPEQKMGGIR